MAISFAPCFAAYPTSQRPEMDSAGALGGDIVQVAGGAQCPILVGSVVGFRGPGGSVMSRISNRLPELDLLRLVAASAVVMYHILFRPTVGGELDPRLFGWVQGVARYGYVGVDLFFLISGFVILMTASRRSPRGFLVHRALRLYPSFWLAMALTIIAVDLMDGRPGAAIDMRTVLANITMVPGRLGAPYIDGVYWTLGVEIKFYVFVFVLMLAGLVRRAELVADLWLVAIAVTSLGYGGALLRSLSLAPHGAFFAGGALLYLVSTSGWTPRRAVGVIAAAVMGQASAVQAMSGFIPDIGSADTLIVRSLAVACFIAVALAATWPRTLRHPNRWAALGALTYPLYLVHARIGRLIFERLQGSMSPIGAALLVIVLVYAVAGLLAWGIELRLVPWLSRHPIIRALEGPAPSAVEPPAT